MSKYDTDKGPTIDHSHAMRIAKHVLRILPEYGAVIAGGLAMQLHGSSRSTRDVDVISKSLPPGLRPVHSLSFGGHVYIIKKVPVDVIVRDDHDTDMYRDAIEDPVFIGGLPVTSTTHMALIKARAYRGKDRADLQFLMKHKLFTMKAVHRLIERTYNGAGWSIREQFDERIREQQFEIENERSKYT